MELIIQVHILFKPVYIRREGMYISPKKERSKKERLLKNNMLQLLLISESYNLAVPVKKKE